MRAILDHILRRFIVLGRLTVRWPDGQLTTYTGEPGPEALMHLRDWRTVRRIALNPALAVGEAYMDGGFVPVDGTIYDVLDLLVTNLASETSRHPIAWTALCAGAVHAAPRPVQSGVPGAPQRRASL